MKKYTKEEQQELLKKLQTGKGIITLYQFEEILIQLGEAEEIINGSKDNMTDDLIERIRNAEPEDQMHLLLMFVEIQQGQLGRLESSTNVLQESFDKLVGGVEKILETSTDTKKG